MSFVPIQVYSPSSSGYWVLTMLMLDMMLPTTISEMKSLGLVRTSMACDSVTTLVGIICTGWVLNVQVMVGTGAPVEVQEMVTDSPSITLTNDPLLAVVLASTIYICVYNNV